MTKAAQALYMSTQGVSQAVKKLETELCTPLFARTSTGVVPTTEANMLKLKAQILLDDFSALKHALSNQEVCSPKVLKIATTTGVFRYLTLDFINDFHTAYPHIHLEIIEQLDSTVEDLLWNEIVDVAFLSAPVNHLKYEAALFSSHHYCVLLHKTHPLAQKEFITYTDLKDQPLAIIRSFNYHFNAFYQANITPLIVYETMDINFLNEITERNHAISITIDFVGFEQLKANTVIKPFADRQCTWDSYIMMKKNSMPSPEAILFKEFALQWLTHNQAKLFVWNIAYPE